MYTQVTRSCSSQDNLYHPQPLRPALSPCFFTPSPPTSTCSNSPSPPQQKPSYSKPAQRPKLAKKISSTTTKHKSVQVSLEGKVERSRGFHAFFVPLARGLPPAPPSSPVFGQSAQAIERDQPPSWQQSKNEEHWVEDIHQPMMELD